MTTPQIINVTFENGLLRPDEPLDLPPHTRLKLIVEKVDSNRAARIAAMDAFERLCREHPISFGEPHLTRDQLHDRD